MKRASRRVPIARNSNKLPLERFDGRPDVRRLARPSPIVPDLTPARTPPYDRASARDLFLVALAAAAFATASPLAKAAQGLSFGPIAAGRCGVAAVALLLLSPVATLRAARALEPRRRAALAVAGLLLAAHFGFFLSGLLATSLAAASALVSLEPLAVVVAAWIAFRERPTRRQQVGLGIAMAGAAVVARSAGQGEHRLAGDALVLVAVVLFGAYVAFARGLRQTMPTKSYAACVYIVAAAALSPLAMPAMMGRPDVASAPLRAWVAVLALGLVPTLVGHTLLQHSARRVPAAIVALVSPGETVGAILIGAAMGYSPTPSEWVGAGLVVLGASVAASSA